MARSVEDQKARAIAAITVITIMLPRIRSSGRQAPSQSTILPQRRCHRLSCAPMRRIRPWQLFLLLSHMRGDVERIGVKLREGRWGGA